MNKRIKKKQPLMKKKREQKILKQFIRHIKKLAKEMNFDHSVKPCPSYEQTCSMMSELLKHTKRNVPLMITTDDKAYIGVKVAQGHENVYECTLKDDDTPVKLELIKSRNLTGELDPVIRMPEECQHSSATYNPYEMII